MGVKSKDPLGAYFAENFEREELVDVELVPIFPTLHNGRSGECGVEKSLDRFFLSSSLIDKLEKYRTWVDSNRLSDHNPIYCQFEFGGKRSNRPFKLNHDWLRVYGFKDLVSRVWNDSSYPISLSPMDLLTMKLGKLKS